MGSPGLPVDGPPCCDLPVHFGLGEMAGDGVPGGSGDTGERGPAGVAGRAGQAPGRTARGRGREDRRPLYRGGAGRGLARDGNESQLSDELVGQVVAAVRPSRPAGHGASWEALVPVRAEVAGWVEDGLTLV